MKLAAAVTPFLFLIAPSLVNGEYFECPTGRDLDVSQVLYDDQAVCVDGANKSGASVRNELGLYNNNSEGKYELQLWVKNKKTGKSRVDTAWTLAVPGDYMLINEYGQLEIINKQSGVIWSRGCKTASKTTNSELVINSNGFKFLVNGSVAWRYNYRNDVEVVTCGVN